MKKLLVTVILLTGTINSVERIKQMFAAKAPEARTNINEQLIKAILDSDKEGIQTALSSGADINYQAKEDGLSPLMIAMVAPKEIIEVI